MKKIISSVLAFVMIAGIFALIPLPAVAADTTQSTTEVGKVEAGYTPTGTAITTAAEFAAMKANGKYYLNADIAIDASYASTFTGIFDGNGHTVTVSVPMFKEFAGTAKNLVIEGSVTNTTAVTVAAGKTIAEYEEEGIMFADAAVGAFAAVGDGTFTNMANKAALSGKCTVGGLVGFIPAEATFTDCVNTGTITYAGDKGQWNALGGISGTTIGNTEYVNCVNNGVIDCGGFQVPTGGIAGTGNSNTKTISSKTMTLKNCVNNAEIKGGWQTGGIVGWVARATLVAEDCTNNGNVNSCLSYSGGVFGRLSEIKSTVTRCVNNGEITSKVSHVGGIAGYLESGDRETSTEFYDCVNNGYINATDVSQNAGGILGSAAGLGEYGANAFNTTVKAIGCVNTGKVISKSFAAGMLGIAGNAKKTFYTEKNVIEIRDCRNSGVIGSDGTKQAGGMVGGAYGCNLTIDGCANTGNITGKRCAGMGGDIGAHNKASVVAVKDAENVYKTKGKGSTETTVSIPFGHTQVTVSKSVNVGIIASPNDIAGGMLGYVWGGERTVNSVKLPFFGKVYSCVNGGTVLSGRFASQFICYSNTTLTVLNDCVAFGKLEDYSETEAAFKSVINVSSINPLEADIKNVKYLENDGTEWFSYAEAPANDKNRRYLLDKPYTADSNGITYKGYVRVKAGNITFLTAADLAGGKVTYTCNELLGKRFFYQTLGKDAAPTVDRTHAPVNLYGGKYFNINEGGASVRVVGDSATVGVRFRSLIKKNIFDAMKADVAEIGVIIAPKAIAYAAGEMTFEALEAYKAASGKTNVYLTLKRSGEYATSFSDEELSDGAYAIKGSLVNVKNASMEFTAVGYVKLADGTVFYGSTDTNSAKAVATAAVADTKSAAEAEYMYEVAEGVFSPYTKEAYENLKALANAK